MKIDEQTLEKLQRLSSLKIDDGHKAGAIESIEEILGFIDNLNSIDISGVDATFTTLEGGSPLREDVVENADISKDILLNAPQSEGNYFIVPKIIE